MLISKFDLYKTEWLDLVFANRNQQYGAYQMRAHYASTLTRAMAITVFAVAAMATTVTIISHRKTVEPFVHFVPVDITPQPVIEHPKKEVLPSKKEPPAAKPAASTPVRVQANPIPRVVPDKEATVEIKPIEENVPTGPVDVPGADGKGQNIPIEGSGPGTGGTGGKGASEDNEPVDIGGLQVMPEPVGGAEAWGRFLQKNLRFPAAARENGASGKVYMSFIIEKDGHLSDIVVLRKAGFGFDEESLRVLKLAPAWKPGVQNGQKVRVRYTIPINFQLADE